MAAGRRRWLATGGALALVAAAIGLAAWTPGTTPSGPRPDGSGSPAPTGALAGPDVFYEIVDADASRLMARRLDGRSQPRVVASRIDVDAGPAWTVDPTGRLAVVVVPVAGSDVQRDLVAYSIADGATRWTVRVDSTQPDWISWAADGMSLAVMADQPEGDHREVVLVDAAGVARPVQIPVDATLLGFATDGGVILVSVVNDGDPGATFVFLRIDPASLAIERLTTLPEVGPRSGGSRSIGAGLGVVVDLATVEDRPATEVRLHDLRTGTARTIATLPSVDLLAIDPAGSSVLVSDDGAVRTIAFDGRASEIFSSDETISDLAWSPDGAYVLVSTYGPPQRLTLVERSSGRSVSLPLPPVADAHLVAVAGGGALPAEPLPATEPAAAPTPAPAGGDVAGMPGLLASWLATENGHLVAHAERLVPTERGGVRVAAGMPPIDLGDAPGPGDRATFIRLVPRPGSSDILVWITTDDTTRGMLWDGSSAVRPLTMPPDWPVNAYDVAWSPDGRRLAGSGPDPSAPEGSPGVLAVAAPGGAHATIVPYVGDYDRLEGWWSATELRVGHVICTEGCPGRYSFSARLRVSDHRLTPLTPADRGHAPVDYVSQDNEHHRIVMTMINEAPETDLRIAWPETLGWHDDIEARVTGDGRSLLVTRTVGVTTEAYRIDDVVGRARNGTLADPKPTMLGTIAGRHLTIEFAPGEAWALVYDRVGGVTLVRIADGRTWPLDRDRDRVWVSPG